MKKRVKEIFTFVIVIGIFAYVINLFFGEATINMLQKVSYNGVQLYKINVWVYLANLQQSMEQTTYLTLEVQSRKWINVTSNILQEQFWQALVNNMAYILNWLIFMINVIVYPFRIGAFVIKQLLVIIGINIDPNASHGLSWLIQFINFMVRIAIPYV